MSLTIYYQRNFFRFRLSLASGYQNKCMISLAGNYDNSVKYPTPSPNPHPLRIEDSITMDRNIFTEENSEE